MAAKIEAVNGKVLKWARERAGLSLEDVAKKFSKEEKEISSWEQGTDFPTYAQLETLSYSIYKRPLAIFFFPEPPEDKEPKVEFRLIPTSTFDDFEADTLFAIREMQARQESLKELTSGINPSSRLITRELHLKKASSLRETCVAVRDIIGISISEQASWATPDVALRKWRLAIEKTGVFVFKRSFKQKEINGFCLTDSDFPIICINNSSSKTRQIFTLFHELGHLLTSSNGFTRDDLDYINFLPPKNQLLEILCNKFASELLVPAEEFKNQISRFDGSEESISDIANHFNVSRDVILRKLLDLNLISNEDYQTLSFAWNKQWTQQSKGSGGNYYRTQASYLGETFLKLCFSKYYRGQLSKMALAEHLGIKQKSLAGLENTLLGA